MASRVSLLAGASQSLLTERLRALVAQGLLGLDHHRAKALDRLLTAMLGRPLRNLASFLFKVIAHNSLR